MGAVWNELHQRNGIATEMKIALLMFLCPMLCFGQPWTFKDTAFIGTAAPYNGPPMDYLTNWAGGTYNGTNEFTAVSTPASMWSVFSISLWLKTSDVTYSKTSSQTALNLNTDTNNKLRIGNDETPAAGHVFCACTAANTARGQRTTTFVLTNNLWSHLVVTFDGSSSVKLYLNGSLQTSSANAYAPGATSQIASQSVTPSGPWKGSISKIKIYGRVITSDEIAKLVAEGY